MRDHHIHTRYSCLLLREKEDRRPITLTLTIIKEARNDHKSHKKKEKNAIKSDKKKRKNEGAKNSIIHTHSTVYN